MSETFEEFVMRLMEEDATLNDLKILLCYVEGFLEGSALNNKTEEIKIPKWMEDKFNEILKYSSIKFNVTTNNFEAFVKESLKKLKNCECL